MAQKMLILYFINDLLLGTVAITLKNFKHPVGGKMRKVIVFIHGEVFFGIVVTANATLTTFDFEGSSIT
jgi:hypothetical protein